MAHIFITENELKRIKELPEIGDYKGNYGRCFLFSGDTLIKTFLDGDKDIYMKGYKSNYIAFPKDTFYTKDINKVSAYTMRLCPGANLYTSGLPLDLEIDKFLEAYKIIQEEIAKYPDIYMYDLESYNIMFDWYKKRFYIIDTDIWQPLDNSMEINQDRLATQLMLLITNRILKWRSHVYNDKKNLKELYSHFVCFKDTRLVLPIFIKELEKNVSSEVGKIKTLGELKLPRK